MEGRGYQCAWADDFESLLYASVAYGMGHQSGLDWKAVRCSKTGSAKLGGAIGGDLCDGLRYAGPFGQAVQFCGNR